MHAPRLRLPALFAGALLSFGLQAQDMVPTLPALASASPTSSQRTPLTPEQLQLANGAVIAGGLVGVAAYGLAKWWEDGFTGSFATQDEGWFGQDTAYGGADKAGHAYAAYFGVRTVSALLQSFGNDRRTAGDLAFWATLGTLTAVEVADGYSKSFKFSAEDAAMNVVGSAFALWCEREPAVDDLIDFRLYYRPSGESDSWDAFGDYSGQRYLVVVKASGVPQLQDVPIVRYVEFAVGYGTKGYSTPPEVTRERNVYVGLQLNLSALLNDTAFRDDRWLAVRRASEVLFDVWQIPGTAVYAKKTL